MIRYNLTCDNGHGFDSWFQSAAAWDRLAAAGQLSCPICGSSTVEKALMAPALHPGRAAEAPPAPGPQAGHPPSARPLSAGKSDLEAAIETLRRQVEENSEYVGMNFVTEARRMHEGEAPERAIHGEARPEEARRLIEDGVPVAPLPFLPTRKTN